MAADQRVAQGHHLRWDDHHLCFADIRSPRTVANIRRGSPVEVNFVDPFARKGYRFKGTAVVHGRGSDAYARGVQLCRAAGVTVLDRITAIIVVEVQEARPLVSPAYDDGTRTEEEIVAAYQDRFARLHPAAPC